MSRARTATKPKAATKPVAGYFRVSKAREEMSAPDIYRGMIEDFCRKEGLRLSKPMFADIDFSGRRQRGKDAAADRPQLEELKQRRHEFSLILFPKLSRAARSVTELSKIVELFNDDGIDVEFLDYPELDSRTPMGKAMIQILGALAELESNQIAERWQDTHRYMAKNGRRSGGYSTPYGYLYNKQDQSFEIVPKQAEIVREIFRRYVRGEAANAIVRDLNNRKVPTKQRVREGSDSVWHTRTLTGMIACTMFAGLLESDGELIEGNWEPIIDRKTFERAQIIRKGHRANWDRKPREGKGMYLLSGILKCDECGANFWRLAGDGKTRKGDYYTCPNGRPRAGHEGKPKCYGGNISAGRAEAMLIDAVAERLGDHDGLRKAIRDKAKGTAGADGKADKLASRLEAIDRKMHRLAKRSLDLTDEAWHRVFEREAEQLAAERQEIEAEIARRDVSGIESRQRVQDIEELSKRIGDVVRILKEGSTSDPETRQQVRRVLDLSIEGARVVGPYRRPKNLEIDWADWLK